MKVKSLVIFGLTILTCLGLLVSAAGNLLLQGRVQDMSQQYQTRASDVLKAQIGDSMKASAGTVLTNIDTSIATKIRQARSWASNTAIQAALTASSTLSIDALYKAWSDPISRSYDTQGVAVGDGSPYNDVAPSVTLLLNDLMSQYGFKQITITDAKGHVIAATGVTTKFDYGPGDWAIVKDASGVAAMTQRGFNGIGETWWYLASNAGSSYYISQYTLDDNSLMYGFAVCVPVYEVRSGALIGVIRAFTAMDDSFKSAIASTSGASDASEVKIVDQSGTILYTTGDKSKIMSEQVTVSQLDSFKSAAQGSSGYLIENDEVGAQMLVGYASDANYKFICLLEKTPAVAYKTVTELSTEMGVVNAQFVEGVNTQTIMLLGGEIIVSVAVLVGFITILNQRLTNPISEMAKVIGKVREGDLNISVNAEGNNEISDLGKALNQMILSLRLTAANFDMTPPGGEDD